MNADNQTIVDNIFQQAFTELSNYKKHSCIISNRIKLISREENQKSFMMIGPLVW